jgi:hypothetical protein
MPANPVLLYLTTLMVPGDKSNLVRVGFCDLSIFRGTFVTKVYFRLTNIFENITVLSRTYFLDATAYLVYYQS